MWSRLLHTLVAALSFDPGRLRLVVPFRLAIGTTIPLLIGIAADQIPLGVAAALGAFICGCADSGDIFPIRARAMVVTAVALFVTALIGGLVSENHLAIVLVSIPVAAACGFAAAFGPHASMTGTLALVIFTIWAGSALAAEAAWAQAIAVGIGGLFQAALALASWPLHRVAAARGVVADVWRTFAVASAGKPKDVLSPALPAQLLSAASQVRLSGARGATRQWLGSLVDSAQELRLPLAAISARRHHLIETGQRSSVEYRELTTFTDAVSKACQSMSRALVLPIRRGRVSPAIQAVREAGTDAAQYFPAQVSAITQAFADVERAMSGPLPIGRRAEMDYRIDIRGERLFADAKAHAKLESPVLRHAIRLTVGICAAWVIGYLLLDAHVYWVALTVAWVLRPDYGSTMGRIVARIAGTLAGLAIIGVVLSLASPGLAVLVAVCTLSAFVLYAFLTVNYSVAVIGVTILVVVLLALEGGQLNATVDNRAFGTVLGGLVCLLVSQILPTLAGPTLVTKLTAVATQARPYVDAVIDGGDVRAASGPLIAARSDAAAAITAAHIEPARGPLDADRAERVLDALLLGIFFVAAIDPPTSRKSTNPGDREAIYHALDDVVGRLETLQSSAGSAFDPAIPPPPRLPLPSADRATGGGLVGASAAFRRAADYLDNGRR